MNTCQVLMKKSPAKEKKHGEKQVSVQIKRIWRKIFEKFASPKAFPKAQHVCL